MYDWWCFEQGVIIYLVFSFLLYTVLVLLSILCNTANRYSGCRYIHFMYVYKITKDVWINFTDNSIWNFQNGG